MASWLISGLGHLSFAYFILNIDPIAFHFGPISVHWYGLAYVVAICVGLAVVFRWTRARGIGDDQVWGLFIWTAIAGLIGGRLYFVVQQPDLLNNYILHPINIISVWNGGMAFFGAIFLGAATLFVLAPRYGISPWLAIDGGALFAAVGQIFGRFGNIINGDITGKALTSGPITVPADTCLHAPCLAYVADQHILAWAIVYANPHSFAIQFVPFQPAPVYEILCNLIALAILWPLRERLPQIRPGYFFTLYAALYAVTQFVVFFFRGSEPTVPFLGIDTLKQAQWTAIVVFILCIPLFFLVRRYSRPWPYSAKNPAPVPVSSSGSLQASTTVAAGAPAGAASMASAASTAVGGTSTTKADVAPTEEGTAWEPQHATHGRLRNLF